MLASNISTDVKFLSIFKRKIVTTVAISFAMSLNYALAETSISNSDLQDLQAELTAIEESLSNYGDGLIKSTMISRREVIKLTIRSLEAVNTAQSNGVELKYTLEISKPDEVKAAAILEEIQRQLLVIAKAEDEAQGAGGLIQALALSRVETEKLALSQLKLGYFQSKYGLPIQTIKSDVGTHEVVEAPTEETGFNNADEAVRVEWADPKYPQINYDNTLFGAYHSQGYRFQGYWSISENESAIDDSKQVMATNFDDWDSEQVSGNPMLVVACQENEVMIAYFVHEYLMNANYDSSTLRVTYRIDEAPAVNTRWSETNGKEAVALYGRKAEAFLPKLYEAEEFFIRVKESNGAAHDATFDLEGVAETFDLVANTCGVSLLELTRDDYKAVQTLLNAGGYGAGKPDGIWGRGSKAALKKFQIDQGLKPTGAIDKQTLIALGLQ